MLKQRSKYVAEGFVEDVGKLMSDFLKLNSVEFPDFASVWRMNYFSLIFMGRPDHTETNEFVNEIFRVTSQYLFEDSFHQQVGAVFILYALFRNQITQPPVKIRLEMKHFKVIVSLREEAIVKKYRTLHYVIEYLMDHAFHYVAHQTLRGPLISGLPTEHDVTINQLRNEFNESGYYSSNNLTTLLDLNKQYMKEKEKIPGCATSTNFEPYQEALAELEDLHMNHQGNEDNTGAGEAKAKIKVKAFRKKAKSRFDEILDFDDNTKFGFCSKDGRVRRVDTEVVKEKKPSRPRKEDRRPGRPRKIPKQEETTQHNSDEDDIDISYLLAQQKELYLPPKYGGIRKCRTKRDPYYKLSPKREDSNSKSDSDNSEK